MFVLKFSELFPFQWENKPLDLFVLKRKLNKEIIFSQTAISFLLWQFWRLKCMGCSQFVCQSVLSGFYIKSNVLSILNKKGYHNYYFINYEMYENIFISRCCETFTNILLRLIYQTDSEWTIGNPKCKKFCPWVQLAAVLLHMFRFIITNHYSWHYRYWEIYGRI